MGELVATENITLTVCRYQLDQALLQESIFLFVLLNVCLLGHSNLITCLTSFFWKKNPVRLQKKEKKVTFGVLRTKVVLKFSVRLQKKNKNKVQVLRKFFERVIQSTTGSYHCCSRASDLRMYISHPSGYRDILID